MPKLTNRQTEILMFIESHINATGAPPTRAEIAQNMGFNSPNAAEDHLKALAKKGVIKLIPGTSRGIRLNTLNNKNVICLKSRLENSHPKIPIIGNVAAGDPILATEHIQGYYEPKNSFRYSVNYMLRVKGNSMINAGILSGDLLAIHATNDAISGQIVIARVNNEVTVKYFYRNDFNVCLKAANPDFPAISLDLRKHDLAIEGLVVGVVRSL